MVRALFAGILRIFAAAACRSTYTIRNYLQNIYKKAPTLRQEPDIRMERQLQNQKATLAAM